MTTSTKRTTAEAALVAATGDGLHLPHHDEPVLRGRRIGRSSSTTTPCGRSSTRTSSSDRTGGSTERLPRSTAGARPACTSTSARCSSAVTTPRSGASRAARSRRLRRSDAPRRGPTGTRRGAGRPRCCRWRRTATTSTSASTSAASCAARDGGETWTRHDRPPRRRARSRRRPRRRRGVGGNRRAARSPRARTDGASWRFHTDGLHATYSLVSRSPACRRARGRARRDTRRVTAPCIGSTDRSSAGRRSPRPLGGAVGPRQIAVNGRPCGTRRARRRRST